MGPVLNYPLHSLIVWGLPRCENLRYFLAILLGLLARAAVWFSTAVERIEPFLSYFSCFTILKSYI